MVVRFSKFVTKYIYVQIYILQTSQMHKFQAVLPSTPRSYVPWKDKAEGIGNIFVRAVKMG